jgi:hypothetical protein
MFWNKFVNFTYENDSLTFEDALKILSNESITVTDYSAASFTIEGTVYRALIF